MTSYPGFYEQHTLDSASYLKKKKGLMLGAGGVGSKGHEWGGIEYHPNVLYEILKMLIKLLY